MRSTLLITDFLTVEERPVILEIVRHLISINPGLRNHRWKNIQPTSEEYAELNCAFLTLYCPELCY